MEQQQYIYLTVACYFKEIMLNVHSLRRLVIAHLFHVASDICYSQKRLSAQSHAGTFSKVTIIALNAFTAHAFPELQ
jgi:hypothetical protein